MTRLITDSMDVAAELEALRDEAAHELERGLGADAELLRQVSERAVDIAYLNGLRDERDIRDIICAWSMRHGMERVPALLDVCEGNHHEVARLVHEQIIRHAEMGIAMSLGMAAGELNRLAARFVNDRPLDS